VSDIKLFRTDNSGVTELRGTSVKLEKSLQTLIERHLETFLGIKFLASEYSTGKTHAGRIDTLGIDENGYPVIIEYKRETNENVINQGLFYLDWLMDHKAEFKLLVMERLGSEAAAGIEWSNPRLLCIAGDFTKYDEYAVQQINRNIELIRYRRYKEEFLLLELVNATFAHTTTLEPSQQLAKKYKGFAELLTQAPTSIQDRYEALRAFALALGDDVQVNVLAYYVAFKRLKNFISVEVRPNTAKLMVYVKVNPSEIQLEQGFTRDVSNINHYGTGDLEITVISDEDLERAKPLILKSYEAS
jgi:predicted transport protein